MNDQVLIVGLVIVVLTSGLVTVMVTEYPSMSTTGCFIYHDEHPTELHASYNGTIDSETLSRLCIGVSWYIYIHTPTYTSAILIWNWGTRIYHNSACAWCTSQWFSNWQVTRRSFLWLLCREALGLSRISSFKVVPGLEKVQFWHHQNFQ